MKKKILISLLSLSMLALTVAPVLALEVTNELNIVKNIVDYGNEDIVTVTGNIIKVVLGFLGLIALIVTIVGGFQWMTSGGNEEKVAGAKKLMSAGIVGLFIILIAYAASSYIVNTIANQVD